MAVTLYKSVVFAAFPSLATVGYQLFNADGSANGSRITAGVTERGTATGIYGTSVDFPSSFRGEIRWDTGDVPVSAYAAEDINLTGGSFTESVLPPAAYPGENDLTDFLTKAGFTIPSGFDLATPVLAAIDAWEEDTGFHPFLSADYTFYFDPRGVPGGRGYAAWQHGVHILDVRAQIRTGILSLTELRTGLTADDTTGNLLTAGEDYWLWPRNAAQEGRPYQGIEFRLRPYGEANSLKVIGTFGFAVNLKQLWWNAILRRAAMEVWPELQYSTTQGGSRLKEGDEEIAFGPKTFQMLPTSWQALYDKQVNMARESSYSLA